MGRFAVPGFDTTTAAAAVAATIGTLCVATADLRTAGEPPCDVRMLLYIPFGSLGRRKKFNSPSVRGGCVNKWEEDEELKGLWY